MSVHIAEFGSELLARYGEVPIAFRVETVFRVEEADRGLGGLRLVEAPLAEPYVKDYDALEPCVPASWARRFDVSNWGFFQADDAGRPVGGAVVALRCPQVHTLAGRNDLALLWDIRVHPSRRGEGIGTALLHHAADWAGARGCTQLRIETQNVNVSACRFYAARSCRLSAIDRHAYTAPRVAHETRLIWMLDLASFPGCQSSAVRLESRC
jgi:GNAT superfamily N-acetyltransferase